LSSIRRSRAIEVSTCGRNVGAHLTSLWLARWPALAAACGLPAGRVIHPPHLSRPVRHLGPYPVWLLYLALVWGAIRSGLVPGRDVALDSPLLAAWTKRDPAHPLDPAQVVGPPAEP
jgi:hypothetical protein